MPEDKLNKIQKLLELVNTDYLTKEEAAKLFADILKALRDTKEEVIGLRKETRNQEASLHKELRRNLKQLEGKIDKSIQNGENEVSAQVKKLSEKISTQIEKINLQTSIDKKEVIESTIKEVKPLIPTIEEIEGELPKLGKPIRDGLELLKDDERLDISAIKGFGKKTAKLSDEIINRALGIVDSRTSFLINKVANLEARPSGSGGGTWGTITGTLSNQTDLQSALDAKESDLTFSTGLTRTVNTITANLSTGISGGQSVIGGTAAGDDLTLQSTAHGTKGNIFFGTSTYDEVNNRLGIGNTAPTHDLTFPSASTGIALYNTADQTTNYERSIFQWNSNNLLIGVQTGGTGAGRVVKLQTQNTGGANTLSFNLDRAGSGSPFFQTVWGSTGMNSAAIVLFGNGTFGASSGTQTNVSISPTIGQSSTAGYTALLINPTESTTGSGAKNLALFQVGGVDKFSVANTGITTITNITDQASNQVLVLQGDRATPANNDEIYQSFLISSSTGVQREFARITVRGPTVTNTSEAGRFVFSTISSGTLTERLGLTSGILFPITNDGIALGTTSLSFSDLFLASGGVINWNNGNATLTHSAGLLTSNVNIAVPDEVYGVSWNGSVNVPTKNAVYDKIEAIPALTDGDKGDITVSSSGTVWTINNDVITYAKMQNVSATSRILGRITAAAGDVEELTGANVRTITGLATSDSPQFTAIELGHASDTTIARVSAGVISVEGVTIATSSNTLTFTNKSMSEAQITFTDITTGNASTSNHGFLKKLSNVSTEFMNGQGNWATPATGGASFPNTQAFSGTGPTSMTDLNLSSIVGVAQKMVFLKVIFPSGGDVWFRKNGETGTVITQTSGTANYNGNPNANEIAYFLVVTDTSGIVEWMSSGSLTYTVTVESYW